jgi:hypothetical protein
VAFKPFNLAGSGGSTPLRITVKGDPETYLFAKLYSATHLRSDRWYKLGRTLLFGQLEDEKAFNRVRRLVQYEDYLLRLMRDAGLPVPPPYGVVEITPEREYLLVTAFLFSRLIDEFALTIELTRTCDRGAPARPPPTSQERGGSTSGSGPGRPTATGVSTCCPAPVWPSSSG